MTVLLVENLKLIMLFMLIGSIIGFRTSVGARPIRRARKGFAAMAGLYRLAARGVKNVGHRT